ncbi:MAG: hypothetical protein ACRDO0_00965, partial [Nocardioidaceae bacterium]
PLAAARLAQRITDAVAAVEVPTPGGIVRPEASVGVGTTGPDVDVPGLLEAADQDMYRSKERPSRVRFGRG